MSVPDVNRKLFDSLLRRNGIYHGSESYIAMCNFLSDKSNSPYLQTYYLLLSGYLSPIEIMSRTLDLLCEMRFVLSGNYSYRRLFLLDSEWYEYFKENAWPSGQRRLCGDDRRGVDGSQIDEIMNIRYGPPVVDLDSAISLQCASKCSI